MKKITFKVSSQKENSLASLIKEVNKVSCRIYMDLENGFVTVENVDDTMIDTVIELIDNYYTILGVDIDNITEEVSDPKEVLHDTKEVSAEKIEVSEVAEEKEEIPQKQPTILEPQSEDDLIIKKVEFKNEYVENLINKFLRTAYWAMFKMNVPEKEIGNFIYTSINEISMKYSYPNQEQLKFSIGDIVDCNYGTHLVGEINGHHVHAIVCNISKTGMVYLVPITKERTDISSYSYLCVDVPQDVIYESNYYKGGTALIDKGKFVRVERLNSVLGKTTPEFFEKLLYKLATTFDFTGYLVETEEENINEAEEIATEEEEITHEVEENPTVTECTAEKVNEAETSAEDTSEGADEKPVETAEEKSSAKKVAGEEEAILEVIGEALDKLDKSKSVSEQIEDFMNEIGFHTSAKLVTQSFVIACDIKKITYATIVLELQKLNPNIKDEIIKASLKENFKVWLEQYPELAEKFPKISIMSILKVFAKRFV